VLQQKDLEATYNEYCEKFASFGSSYYDAENKTCALRASQLFLTDEAESFFEKYGGKDHKCLTKTSDYSYYLIHDDYCKTTDHKMLRCNFLRFYFGGLPSDCPP